MLCFYIRFVKKIVNRKISKSMQNDGLIVLIRHPEAALIYFITTPSEED